MPHRWLLPLSLLTGLWACESEPEEAPEAEVPEQCKNVHLDRLSADWLGVVGGTGDPKTRMRVMPGEAADKMYEAWYIGGFFTRTTLKGLKRTDDVQFTELPTAAKQRRIDAGEAQLMRMYIKPSLKDCALKAYVGTVDKDGKEQVSPKAIEFVAFPEQAGVEFAFQPPDETLFLGAAARDKATADKMLSASGQADPNHDLGPVPVGGWSAVARDGDPSCTYDMDLFFDDRKVNELSPSPAGAVADGFRPWFHEWDAPYSGNHHFEFHRFRTCADGKRELLAVAAIEAVLF